MLLRFTSTFTFAKEVHAWDLYAVTNVANWAIYVRTSPFSAIALDDTFQQTATQSRQRRRSCRLPISATLGSTGPDYPGSVSCGNNWKRPSHTYFGRGNAVPILI